MEHFHFPGRPESRRLDVSDEETEKAKEHFRLIAAGEIKTINITPEEAEDYVSRIEEEKLSEDMIKSHAANYDDYREARKKGEK